MKMTLSLLHPTLMVLALASCKYQVAVTPPWKKENPAQGQEVQFEREGLRGKIELAKATGKPVFLDFYTQWCGPCRVMDREVFTHEPLALFLNTHFLNLKVDAEKGEGIELARQFGISAYPTLLFLDAKGVEQKRVVGIVMAPKLLKMGKVVQAER